MDDLNFLQNSLNKEDSIKSELVKPLLYLIEDDLLLGKSIKKSLEKKLNISILFFQNPDDFFSHLDEVSLEVSSDKLRPSIVLTDISFDSGDSNTTKIDGLGLLDKVRALGIKHFSIAMTGFASIETAISATKKGVYHYLTKPFEMIDLENILVQGIEENLGIKKEDLLISNKNKFPQVSISKKSNFKFEDIGSENLFCGMVGKSPLMIDLFSQIERIALSESTVLIQGESGTGKEPVTKAIHSLSNRCDNRLVSVNCGAIPGELLESELFGHKKGSFTGAVSDRKGRFEMAEKGTIFLDEIGDMPLLLQVKLLRVLQERKVEPVGGDYEIPINVRLVSATHRNLDKHVADGKFREDLFYRLNVIPVKIPPLRERKEDIGLLISYFMNKYCSADGRNLFDFSCDAYDSLLHYSWPGNVRELENLIERLVILKGGQKVELEDLPQKISGSIRSNINTKELIILPDDGMDLKSILCDIEESLILQALNLTKGNKNQASKLLKINRTTLIEKMKKKSIFQNL